jgi:uncharacterized membrane protein
MRLRCRGRRSSVNGGVQVQVNVNFRCLFALALALAACGDGDESATCDQPDLTYDTFGEPFMTDWCTGCHSAQLLPYMRQNAPLDVNFDTLDENRAQSEAISLTVSGATMPPEGGPSDDERQMLVQWLGCGAP